MNRRQFIATATSSVAAATVIPSGSTLADTTQIDTVLNSFAIQPRAVGNSMAFFIKVDPEKTNLTTGNFNLNVQNTISQRLPEDKWSLLEGVQEIEFDHSSTEIDVIMNAAKEISKVSIQCRGNHYAVMDDCVLVWYNGSREFNNPLQRFGDDTIALHPHFKDFFVKVKGVKLEKHHHEQLEKQGFTRVV